MDKNKLILPVAIILGCIVLGGSFFAVQASKQRSIEKQQEVELQAKSVADQVRAEQDRKEYLAKRKSDCLDIYKTEGAKWNNVNGWRYDDAKDTCYVEYKRSPVKTDAQCDADYKGDDGKVLPIFFKDWLLCKDGLFEKTF